MIDHLGSGPPMNHRSQRAGLLLMSDYDVDSGPNAVKRTIYGVVIDEGPGEREESGIRRMKKPRSRHGSRPERRNPGTSASSVRPVPSERQEQEHR